MHYVLSSAQKMVFRFQAELFMQTLKLPTLSVLQCASVCITVITFFWFVCKQTSLAIYTYTSFFHIFFMQIGQLLVYICARWQSAYKPKNYTYRNIFTIFFSQRYKLFSIQHWRNQFQQRRSFHSIILQVEVKKIPFKTYHITETVNKWCLLSFTLDVLYVRSKV